MPAIVFDKNLERSILRTQGEDRGQPLDEVWDGVYVVMPRPNDEHQEIVTGLIVAFHTVLGHGRGGKVRPGVNVSDRDGDWTQNYRGPDVVVFLEGTTAQNRGAYWLGGPDFAVEILSKGDRARKKLEFYAKVNVRELLLIDRNPWSLELYRLREGVLELAGRSTAEDRADLTSAVLSLDFRLVPGESRPIIELLRRDGEQRGSI